MKNEIKTQVDALLTAGKSPKFIVETLKSQDETLTASQIYFRRNYFAERYGWNVNPKKQSPAEKAVITRKANKVIKEAKSTKKATPEYITLIVGKTSISIHEDQVKHVFLEPDLTIRIVPDLSKLVE
jgi:hypothetical protein